jgi:hypothetical protein
MREVTFGRRDRFILIRLLQEGMVGAMRKSGGQANLALSLQAPKPKPIFLGGKAG